MCASVSWLPGPRGETFKMTTGGGAADGRRHSRRIRKGLLWSACQSKFPRNARQTRNSKLAGSAGAARRLPCHSFGRRNLITLRGQARNWSKTGLRPIDRRPVSCVCRGLAHPASPLPLCWLLQSVQNRGVVQANVRNRPPRGGPRSFQPRCRCNVPSVEPPPTEPRGFPIRRCLAEG